MAIDLQAGGHRFDFITGMCMRCKMSIKKFEDSGRPLCTGRPADRGRSDGPDEKLPSGVA
jgi:hypothetical protein